jgi:hypothetical protein
MNTARLTGKRIKVMAFLFVVSLAAFSGTLMAKTRKAAELVVMKTDGNPVRGELITVKQHVLLLMDWQTRGDVSIDIRNAKYIKIIGKSHAGKGAFIGFIVGGALGGGATLLAASEKSSGAYSFRVPASAALIVGPITGGIGSLIGALIGGLAGGGHGKSIQIEGVSDAQLNAILDDLRSRALIPDAQ